MTDSPEWLRNLAMNYADAQPGMRPEDHPAWDIAAEIERQHKQIDDAEAMIEQLTADEEQLRASAKEDAAEIERLQIENQLLFEHISGNEKDLARFNSTLRRALGQK